MLFYPAAFEECIVARRAWIQTAMGELAALGYPSPDLITYCENLFAEYGPHLTPKQALLPDREYAT